MSPASERLPRSRITAMTLDGGGYRSGFSSGRDSDRGRTLVFLSHLLHSDPSTYPPSVHIRRSIFCRPPSSIHPRLCSSLSSLSHTHTHAQLQHNGWMGAASPSMFSFSVRLTRVCVCVNAHTHAHVQSPCCNGRLGGSSGVLVRRTVSSITGNW